MGSQLFKECNPYTLSHHYNLIAVVHQLAEQIPFSIQWSHVGGHQNGKTIMALPHDAWLNIEVDATAKASLARARPSPIKFHLPYGPWVCYVGLTQVVKQFAQMKQMHLSSPALVQFWSKKRQLSPEE